MSMTFSTIQANLVPNNSSAKLSTMKVTKSNKEAPMKKKFFLSALLISLFGLTTAKPVQADTSVADI